VVVVVVLLLPPPLPLWRPGSARAARPAKAATSAPATVSATVVVRRSRRSAVSRSWEARPCGGVVDCTIEVQQRQMNVR
jgi:hypothetical protein